MGARSLVLVASAPVIAAGGERIDRFELERRSLLARQESLLGAPTRLVAEPAAKIGVVEESCDRTCGCRCIVRAHDETVDSILDEVARRASVCNDDCDRAAKCL